MAADDLATQEARASAAMALTNKYNAKNILVWASEGLHITSYGNFGVQYNQRLLLIPSFNKRNVYYVQIQLNQLSIEQTSQFRADGISNIFL